MTNPVAGRAAWLWTARATNLPLGQAGWCLLLAVVLTGCGGGGGGSGSSGGSAALDAQVRSLAVTSLGLSGDPATPRGLERTVPATDPLVKLGQLLFFSQTLAASYDVSCGTCHHPDFGGSDGLSLPVGVVPRAPASVGPGREVDPYRDLDPSGGDGGPNMHRNSITTYNSALFDRALMYDGRVFVVDAAVVSGGHGQNIRTPESGQTPDLNPLDGLVEFAVKGPIVNDNEMRGFLYTDFATPTDYRQHLVQRLLGTVDTQYNPKAGAADNWLARFRAAFNQPTAAGADLITIDNIERALSAYVDSQIFVDTPWRSFLDGDASAISDTAKKGARLFLTSVQDGGLGCNSCHAGDRFTDESFHNVAFPQFGRGFGRSDHRDWGHWVTTRLAEDLQTFRTPSLLNIARTAPYGHTGAFATLEDLLAYHANPRAGVSDFDFTLSGLQQFREGTVSYPWAGDYTRDAISLPNFRTSETLLPARSLTSTETSELVAFLNTLTDRCVSDPACISQWAPVAADDPDGHTLIRDHPLGTPDMVDAQRASNYVSQIPMSFPVLPGRTTFADVQGCTNKVGTAVNTGQGLFVQHAESGFGLVDRHGYAASTWFTSQQSTLEATMAGGGVTAAYLDDDCWPDLVFTGGDISGMRFYHNDAGLGFTPLDLVGAMSEREFTGTAVADLNGDYRRELLLSNIKPGSVPVYSADGTGLYQKVADLPMVRPTYGISFAPLDDTGNLYMYLSHWSGGTGTSGTSPALWRSDGANLYSWDRNGRTTSAFVNQQFNFTPKFADFTGDGRIDLVIASDFSTSTALRNVPYTAGGWYFENETDQSIITDQNGMGSALLDIDNDGNLEWFVTSIRDFGAAIGNWGVSGNRLYRNVSTGEHMGFTDITEQAGVRDGYWGWGACAADFNNDGFIDLFHVNGFGRIPDDVVTTEATQDRQTLYNSKTEQFQDKPPLLFINNADGTFSDAAASWGIAVPSEGRGIACFDYDRDGDIDITVFDHSRVPQFFENRIGNGAAHRFIGIRLVGSAPNTDAIGAKVYVTADVGLVHGVQTQLRLSEANSNFNSQNLPDLHFGLGDAAVVGQLRVVWPGGAELTCQNVAINQFLVIDQRDGQGACPAP
jgi:cytochrome c peroxidase